MQKNNQKISEGEQNNSEINLYIKIILNFIEQQQHITVSSCSPHQTYRLIFTQT